MRRTCEDCGKVYDDCARWTICPHPNLGDPAPTKEESAAAGYRPTTAEPLPSVEVKFGRGPEDFKMSIDGHDVTQKLGIQHARISIAHDSLTRLDLDIGFVHGRAMVTAERVFFQFGERTYEMRLADDNVGILWPPPQVKGTLIKAWCESCRGKGDGEGNVSCSACHGRGFNFVDAGTVRPLQNMQMGYGPIDHEKREELSIKVNPEHPAAQETGS